MPVKDQKVTHDGKKITISRPMYTSLAYTTYTEDLFKLVDSTTWTRKISEKGKEYLKSSKLGLLHQLVINYFYGKDVLKEAYEKDYVIDHLDNNGYDCSYENLALIPKKENSAKGLTYDIEREKSIKLFALNITKDILTEEFQISVSFNQPSSIRIEDEEHQVATIYLRYGIDYKTAFIDARSILNDLNESGYVNFANLRHKGFDYRKADVMFVTNEEVESGIIIRNGEVYFLQGSKNVIMAKACHNENLHKDIQTK